MTFSDIYMEIFRKSHIWVATTQICGNINPNTPLPTVTEFTEKNDIIRYCYRLSTIWKNIGRCESA